jgi:hypothetical protein
MSVEQIQDLIQRGLLRPGTVEVRRCLGVAIGRLVLAGILLALGGLCLGNFHEAWPLLIGLGLLLVGVWKLVQGLIGICDRSPQLTIGPEALIDHRSGRTYPWSAILRATLHRTTRRGSEESATLVLYLSQYVRDNQVEIDLLNLDRSSDSIFHLVGQRANLR